MIFAVHPELQEFNTLEKTGKIHSRLRNRILFLIGVGTVSTGMIVYDIFFRDLEPLGVVGFASFGFILGFFIFNKINKLTWDEDEEVVKIGKFDLATFIILAGYIIYRILIHVFLENAFHKAILVSGYSLATLVGGIIGRILGMIWLINRIHRENNRKNRSKVD